MKAGKSTSGGENSRCKGPVAKQLGEGLKTDKVIQRAEKVGTRALSDEGKVWKRCRSSLRASKVDWVFILSSVGSH